MKYEVIVEIIDKNRIKKIVFILESKTKLSDDEIESKKESLSACLDCFDLEVSSIYFSSIIRNKTDISLKNNSKIKKLIKHFKNSDFSLV